MSSSKRTTSIVDISEIEDDEAEQLEAQVGQRQHHQDSQRADKANSPAATAAAAAQLYLYHEDVHPQQRVSSLLSSMKNNLQLPPTGASKSADTSPSQTLARGSAGGQPLAALDYPAGGRLSPAARSLGADTERRLGAGTPTQGSLNRDGQQQRPEAPQKANLGTLTGVYFPCVQNIFGVILFIRMVWIVGTAGVPAAFALVFICCCVTFTTSISLSAIATNGIVPAGGSYFMISRSLGPECGGAVGTLFFLGTTVAGAMYITGAVEIMLNYMAPSWGLFGDFQRDVNILYHNIRVYGTLLLILVGLMVWIGVRFVSKLAPVALFCVLFSIFSIYLGIFINYDGRPDLHICVLGERLVTLKNMPGEWANEPTGEPLPTSALNSSLARSREEMARLELKRMRALCTYEKLRFVFCPQHAAGGSHAARHRAGQSARARQAEPADQDSEPWAGTPQPSGQGDEREQDEKQLMRDLFKRPPNMSNCDPYFTQNRDRIHLERAVPGK